MSKDILKELGDLILSSGKDRPAGTYILHGTAVPLFDILPDDSTTDAIIICTPEYVQRIMKDLQVSPGRRINGGESEK